MGESLKPEDLKNQATNDTAKVPKDFQNWGLIRIPPGMKLRNKLTPSSLASVPAITLSNSNTITETRTTLSFSSDDDNSGRSTTSSLSSIRSLSEIVIPRFRNRAPGFLNEKATPQKPILKKPVQQIQVQLPGPKQKGPYSLEGTDSQPSLLAEAPQQRTTETGVALVPRRFVNYLPAPNKAFPLGHLKPLPPPGAFQRKRPQPVPKKTLPLVLEKLEDTDPIDVIETVPLPFKHKDEQFTTSTPAPSPDTSSKGSDSSYQTAEQSIGPYLNQTQNLELNASEQPSSDQEEINKENLCSAF